jgi:hypothetical protein
MSALVLAKTDPFSPYRIPRSILRAWWCADDHGTALMTDDGGGLISSWKDRINALEVTAATTARATWGEAAFNAAHPGLTFDGVANGMVMASLDTLIPSGSSTSTIVAVCDPGAGNPSAGECAVSYGANGSSTRRQIQRTQTGASTPTALQVNDSSSNYAVTGIANGWAAPGIIVAQFEAALLSVWQDGASVGTDDGTLNTTPTKLVIGANAATTPAAFFGGPIRHVMIFAGALTTVQRHQLEGWLAWDSGLTGNLPSSHPYKLMRP